jgi:hypothetical protein
MKPCGSCPGWPDCGCGTQSGPHTCEWQDECRRRFREAGIDVAQSATNLDGSDFHLMNAIEAEVTREWLERRVATLSLEEKHEEEM